MKRKFFSISFALVLVLSLGLATAVPVAANSVASSTMIFEGELTDNGDGTYSGYIPMVNEAVGDHSKGGYDVYAQEGALAWFGDDSGTGPVWTPELIDNHNAWPTWDPNTPDWYQYSLNLYVDGDLQKWAVRNHPGATAAHPWYDTAWWGSEKPPMGVPMSGAMDWTGMYAAETDVGAYLPSTGTPEIPGGAAGYGGGPMCWDMDWSWGSEMVPLQYPGFSVEVIPLEESSNYRVILTPALPSFGFVTGGGWIDSPPGAYMPIPGTIITPADISTGPGHWHPANEQSDGVSQITNTQPDSAGGGGSLEQSLPSPTTPSPKTDFEIFSEDVVYEQGKGIRATNGGFGLLAELDELIFDWYRDGTSTAPGHLTPALRLWVWDPDVGTYGTSALLIWEGVYNDYSGPVPTDIWITEDILIDNFWRVPQWIDGVWKGIWYCNNDPTAECYIYDRGLHEWSLGLNTVVIGMNVGLGSGWDGTYHSFVDLVTIGFDGESTMYNFEPVAPLTGKASFGFVAKYKKGASVPDGQTQFMFQTADLNFHSNSYEWLVIAGDTAKVKGVGTINGMGEYRFMLWAGDNETDTFRIKIWTEDNNGETVIYDNGYDNGMNQPIAGGNIVIHTSKTSKN